MTDVIEISRGNRKNVRRIATPRQITTVVPIISFLQIKILELTTLLPQYSTRIVRSEQSKILFIIVT